MDEIKREIRAVMILAAMAMSFAGLVLGGFLLLLFSADEPDISTAEYAQLAQEIVVQNTMPEGSTSSCHPLSCH